jgi:hypothetical protein
MAIHQDKKDSCNSEEFLRAIYEADDKRRTDPNSYGDEQLHRELLQDAPIENYYVYEPEGCSGLIMFCDDDGNPWILTVEDSGLNEAYINYLEKQGVPIFDDWNSFKKYEEVLQSKIKGK